MHDLRKHMNLFESSDFEPEMNKELEEEVVDETCGIGLPCDDEELDESDLDPTDDHSLDAGLDGMLDPRALAKLLPDVDDVTRFTNAVRKVQKGDIATLSIQETRQLAKAFISLLMDDSQTTVKVLQKLKMVQANDADTI